MKTKSGAGGKARKVTILWHLHYHQQVNLVMDQERVNTYLSNQLVLVLQTFCCCYALLLALRPLWEDGWYSIWHKVRTQAQRVPYRHKTRQIFWIQLHQQPRLTGHQHFTSPCGRGFGPVISSRSLWGYAVPQAQHPLRSGWTLNLSKFPYKLILPSSTLRK